MSIATPAISPLTKRAALSYELTPYGLSLTMFAICLFSAAIFNDSDTWLHIAAGDWMLAHRAIPHVDPFTSSFGGQPWTAHEWLSELLMSLAYKAGGFLAVSLLTGAAAAMAVFIVSRRAACELGGPALLILGASCLLLTAPSLLARPHVLALPVFALWTVVLLKARDADTAPPLAAAALMTLWANLHGGFAFGLALLAPFGLEAVLAAQPGRKLGVARDWSVFALAALTAALVNPFGLNGLTFPIRLLRLQALSQIGEWGPETFAHPNALEVFLLALIGVALTRPLRLSPVRLALLLGLIHLSLAHARHEMLLAFLAPGLLARPLADALGSRPSPSPIDSRASTVGALSVATALLLLRVCLPAPSPVAAESVRAALAALPAPTRIKPVLNGYAFGGYLIFDGVRPYVDGRADLFGDAFLRDYSRVAQGDRQALAATLETRQIGWTMFAPEQGATSTMDAMPGWRRAFADPRVVVHVRAD